VTFAKNERLTAVVEEIRDLASTLSEHDLELSDLDRPVTPVEATVAGTRRALRDAIAVAVKRRRSVERAFKRAYEPFEAAVNELAARWAADKPKRRYPGGSALPPLGQKQLSSFLTEYVLAHKALPIGRHLIPPGPDILSNVGPAFEVDFDALRDPR
jgi:hypothetical protein